MNIIQSYWSKPAFHKNQDFSNNRKFGGWLSYKYFLYSLCFSCLTIKRHHKTLDLYTDDDGYDLFINKLKLPYDNVLVILNELNGEDHRLWVLGKLKAILLQDHPFIHVDNDVFLWDSLPDIAKLHLVTI